MEVQYSTPDNILEDLNLDKFENLEKGGGGAAVGISTTLSILCIGGIVFYIVKRKKDNSPI